MLFDDVEFLFDELVGEVQRDRAARATRVRAQLVLFSLEVAGQRIAPSRLCFRLRRTLGGGLFGRLWAIAYDRVLDDAEIAQLKNYFSAQLPV